MRSRAPAPDFVIAGAPRCGTTSLYVHLGRHRQICMSSTKEPRFFSPGSRSRLPGLRDREMGRDWYQALWAHCPDGALRGEASTAYFSDPATPGLLREAAPDVKIVIVLRDPVDRLHSHYLHDLRARRMPPLEELARTEHPRFRSYVDVSRYAGHVERYLTTFPGGGVRVWLLDDLRDRPDDTFRELFGFLGADTEDVPGGLDAAINVSAAVRSRALNRVFAWRPLPWPRLNRTWQRLSTAVYLVNERPIRTALDPELRRRLLPLFTEDVTRLEGLIGRDLGRWKTV